MLWGAKQVRIHIFGASGSGTTTLAKALTKELCSTHLDTDDYFWEIQYTNIRELGDRIGLLKRDLENDKNLILSGAVCGWGDELIEYFDIVIFLWLPSETRLERLKKREFERYGEEIFDGGSKHEQYKEFMEWSGLYDHAGLEVRSKALHDDWLKTLTCPVLRIEGDYTVQERIDMTKSFLLKNEGLRQ